MPHTPGPWAVDLPWALKNGGCYVVMSENEPVANCGPNGAANAQLIAAAPALLAACRAALWSFERYETEFTDHPLFGTLRAAIAQAEGRQP